jgi:hypothetical protein
MAVMKYKAKRIRQILMGLAALLGLSVSSVAACTCSHHRESPQPSHSCHQAANDHHSESGETIAAPAFNEICVCVPQATKLSVKSEGFKLKKHPADFAVVTAMRNDDFRATRILLSTHSLSPLYRLQFSGVISSRGPPAA